MSGLSIEIEKFVNSLPDALVITNETWNIISANEQAIEILELKESDFQSQSILNIIPFHDAQVFQSIKTLECERTISFEDIIQHESGFENRVNIRVRKIKDNKKTYYSWLFLDYSEELESKQRMIDFMAQLNVANNKIVESANQIKIFQELVNNLNQGIIISNSNEKVFFINSYAKNLFLFKKKVITVSDIIKCFTHSVNVPLDLLHTHLLHGKLKSEVIILNQHDETETRCYLTVFTVENNLDPHKKSLVWNFVEMQEEMEMQQRMIDFTAELTSLNRELTKKNDEILKISRVDGLTQINNRTYILELLDEIINHANGGTKQFSIIIFDIDDFKKFNDENGHQFGDVVLKTVVSTAWEILEDNGMIGRYGGEEFFIILPNLGMEEAYQLSEKIRKAIASETCTMGVICKNTTITLGISTYVQGDSIDSLIRRADLALYQGKKSGKNCSVKS
ncbi:MAG: sensor domain-containing diguanylate cyclase [Spirochaetes bacterium]|nr:sensor domain-containing diguanylate cyclase [Spirochaetota bacterium]